MFNSESQCGRDERANVQRTSCAAKNIMRTSRDPLHPLRTWREVWQAEGLPHDPLLRERAALRANPCKQTKRPAFHWFNQLLNRDGE
jgi:hypothetical protein